MKKSIIIILAALACVSAAAGPGKTIRISTDRTDLVLEVAENGRLYQKYFGEKLLFESDAESVRRPGAYEVCSCLGNEDYFEPALGIIHNDGNRTTYLYYEDSAVSPVPGGTKTSITLKDRKYPVTVVLNYVAYPAENVIKAWSEISHSEKKPVTLTHFYSTMIYLDALSYHLTEYASEWAEEMRMQTEVLQRGKKVVDTKLGSRAAMITMPHFMVGLDREASENSGKVLLGSVAWPGNFRYLLEVDNHNTLRVLPGLNNEASEYLLKPGEVFTTPEFIFSLSQNGISEASRGFHDWARRYQVKDGMGTRMSLLNNWENTSFNFDEPKLAAIMKEAKKLGVDLFLLDDGWFGNGEDARNDDNAGLGDWEVNREKLPGGVPALVNAAKDAGVRFGIWIEPEMVNPQSKLFRDHPDWVITNPGRDLYFFRNQLVLDLSNPKVQDYVFSIIDNLMQENPDLAFFKWDCNSPITNIYSPYLKDRQGQLYIDHARGVINVMKRAAEKYPGTPMMLCSGGGARCDFESMKYFTEFWASDNTNPIERIYIQWGFSQFLPAKTICAHVTSWNRNTSVKFRTDVASMCKLGFDIGLQDLKDDELQFCREAIANWKRLNPAILDGDQYRLVSPYETNHMALDYVSKDKGSAVLFTYDIHPRYGEKTVNVKLQGLDPSAKYKVREINLMPGRKSNLKEDGLTLSGDFLMKVGLAALTGRDCNSRVIELTRE